MDEQYRWFGMAGAGVQPQNKAESAAAKRVASPLDGLTLFASNLSP
jgi:hypothetical protein